jgi:hypothetical protein
MMLFRPFAHIRASVSLFLTFLFLCMMMAFPLSSLARGAGQPDTTSVTGSNATRIMLETERLLSESRIIRQLDASVAFKALVPQRYELRLAEHLRTQGVRLRLDDAPPLLELRVFTENRLEQLPSDDEVMARRLISGELHLFISDEQSEISDTKVLEFSYRDTLHGDSLEAIISDSSAGAGWAAAQFADVKALPEQPGRWKRYGEPAIITAATGITVFLLFNVRS